MYTDNDETIVVFVCLFVCVLLFNTVAVVSMSIMLLLYLNCLLCCQLFVLLYNTI